MANLKDLRNQFLRKTKSQLVDEITSLLSGITEQKILEEALDHKEMQIRIALEHMPSGIRLIDKDRNYVFFNARYSELYDFPEGLLKVGESFRVENLYQAQRGDFGPGDPDELTDKWFAEWSGPLVTTSWERVTVGGTVLEVKTSPTPDGGIVNIVSDISERKRAEEALYQARENLEKRVEERTRELTDEIAERKRAQAQVIQASKLATLGEMATSVAHELNQPLNIIRLAAGNSRRKLVKGEVNLEYLDQKLERIQNQAVRAATIIDHMQMFGRKAEGKDIQIDPRTVIRNALGLVGEQLRLSQIEVATELPDACPYINGNMIRMEQVILNLLTNARDAIEYHGGKKKITLRVVEKNDGIQIISEDTGGGISPEALSRIFEPFYTTKDIGKGTGLGLSVSYGIIRDMGGTIEAENTDAGARFTITLPIAE